MFEAKSVDWENSFSGKITKLNYILPGLLSGTTGAIVGSGGTGKTYLGLSLATGIVAKNLLGWGPEPGDSYVKYLNAEDPLPVIEYRAMHLGTHLSNEERERVSNFVDIIALHGQRPEILNQKAERNDNWIEWLKKEADGCKLLIIDTLRKFHQADENSSSQMTLLTQILDEIASETGCSIVFMHHANKASIQNGLGADQIAGRGSTALTDNIRWQINLTRMSSKEARRESVNEHLTSRYVRLSGSKINYEKEPGGFWLKRSHGGILVRANINKRCNEVDPINRPKFDCETLGDSTPTAKNLANRFNS